MAGGRVDEEQLEAPEAAAARGDDREGEDQPARLPEDVLAAILHRVRPRWLAVSRCVCKTWRDTVDGRGLLRADLLPLSLAGLFVHFDEHEFPEFFARPSTSTGGASAVSGDLSFVASASSPHCGHIYDEDCVHWSLWGKYGIDDHCNGLLLLSVNCVVNPATRRWQTLPRCPPKHGAGRVIYRAHLVYDPMISPYYDVVMIPTLDGHHRDEVNPLMEESEWPPSRCKMYVLSSKLGYWEEKYFVREGDPAGTVRQMREGFVGSNAVYFRGALYVHCRPNFLMRVSLVNNTYRVVKPPVDAAEDYCRYRVVKSKKGLYFLSFNNCFPLLKCWLQVWILNESCGQIEWMLNHDKSLKPVLARRFYRRAQWILQEINYTIVLSSSHLEEKEKVTCEASIEWNSDEDVEDEYMVDHCYLQDKKKSVTEENLEWNSDDHNTLNNGDADEEYFSDEEHHVHCYGDIEILGFHPYKEIVFLSASQQKGLAYHLNGSKIEELGNMYPKEYSYFQALSNQHAMIKSFPYTPCWLEEFPRIS
ncbi:hypothetical protein ACQ4PT_064400 [Festuca glaucescens]